MQRRRRGLLTIGQFATLCEITPKALRHYEKLGLFFPREIDPDTGYRYYDEDQVWELNELLSLKRSGFVLKDLQELLKQDYSREALAEVFQRQEAKLREELKQKNYQLLTLFQWWEIRQSGSFRNLQKQKEWKNVNDATQAKISVKTIPAFYGAVCRRTLKDFPAGLPELIQEAYGKAIQLSGGDLPVAAPIVCYHDSEISAKGWDVSAVVPVKGKMEGAEAFPEISALSYFHIGPYDTVHQSWQSLYELALEKGWELYLPSQEIYHNDPRVTEPEKLITEILIHVRHPEKIRRELAAKK